MPADFLGHETAISLAYQPRPGQWVLFNLEDREKQALLIAQGAHATFAGQLVAIHSAAHWTSAARVTRGKTGRSEYDAAGYVPSRLMLCDYQGNNLELAVRREGHITITNVFVYLESPSIRDLEPLLDLKDLPPGYTPAPGWQPAA